MSRLSARHLDAWAARFKVTRTCHSAGFQEHAGYGFGKPRSHHSSPFRERTGRILRNYPSPETKRVVDLVLRREGRAHVALASN